MEDKVTLVTIRFSGDKASGKTVLLNKIRTFLEKEGHEVMFQPLKDEHKILVQNKFTL